MYGLHFCWHLACILLTMKRPNSSIQSCQAEFWDNLQQQQLILMHENEQIVSGYHAVNNIFLRLLVPRISDEKRRQMSKSTGEYAAYQYKCDGDCTRVFSIAQYVRFACIWWLFVYVWVQRVYGRWHTVRWACVLAVCMFVFHVWMGYFLFTSSLVARKEARHAVTPNDDGMHICGFCGVCDGY